jgi:hypothetical protein
MNVSFLHLLDHDAARFIEMLAVVVFALAEVFSQFGEKM